MVPLLILVNLMEPLRGSTTVYALYRHTLLFQVWKSFTTHRARIIIRYLCLYVNNIPNVETTMQCSTAKCNWGKATERQLYEYTTHCETLLSSHASLYCEATYCTNTRAPILITSTVLKPYREHSKKLT